MAKEGRFLILGGGISGLSAAYRLLQKVSNARDITVVEKTSRLGGWIQSKCYEDGAVFELGPRGLRPASLSGRSSLELVRYFIMHCTVCSIHLAILNNIGIYLEINMKYMYVEFF